MILNSNKLWFSLRKDSLEESLLILHHINGEISMRWFFVPFVLSLGLLTNNIKAAVQEKAIEYSFEGTKLKGVLYYDDASKAKRPGILVVHEFWGLNDHARERAKKLAEMGYVAFACDMYGEGKSTEHPQEAGQMAGEVRKNIKIWQGRAIAGFKELKKCEYVDSAKTAVIGFCFGGSTALELAYSGADLGAVVTFHGALPVPTPEQAKAIKAKILICHGASDVFIPEDSIQKFRKVLEDAKVDYQMIYYSNTTHSFTVPGVEKKMSMLRYNADSDRRSWQQMKALFDEVFTGKK